MKIRVRFGIKRLIPLLPNAGIVVAYMTDEQFEQVSAAVQTINMVGSLVGLPVFVCERV